MWPFKTYEESSVEDRIETLKPYESIYGENFWDDRNKNPLELKERKFQKYVSKMHKILTGLTKKCEDYSGDNKEFVNQLTPEEGGLYILLGLRFIANNYDLKLKEEPSSKA